MKKIYTTGQVAKLCQVASRTVCKWIDAGLLPGFRLPGSPDRRVTRDSLVKFLRENGMPTDAFGAEGDYKVLLVGVGNTLADKIESALPDVHFVRVGSFYDAGVQVQEFRPDAVVVDFVLGRTDSLSMAQSLKPNQMQVVGLAGEDESSAEGALQDFGFARVLRRPFDPRDLVEQLRPKEVAAVCHS